MDALKYTLRLPVCGLLALCFLLPVPARCDTPGSPPSSAVADFAGVMSPAARGSIETVCGALLEKTGVALVVVTVGALGAESIEEAASRTWEKWGIGARDRDEGALILVSTGDRQVRIETGYGSEGYLTDLETGRIISQAAPFLSRQAWDDGLLLMAVGVARITAAHHGIDMEQLLPPVERAPPRPQRHESSGNGIFILLIVLFLLVTPFGRRLLFYMLLSSMLSGGRGSGWGGGGFSGGFGRSGGFGGFGGGRSGGGGASGRF